MSDFPAGNTRFAAFCCRLTDDALFRAIAHMLGRRPGVQKRLQEFFRDPSFTSAASSSSFATSEEDEADEDELGDNAADMASANTVGAVGAARVSVLKSKNITDETKTRIAECLGQTISQLLGSPNAKGAVCALKALNRVSVTQGTESLGEEAGTAMLYAQRCVRDVVVMRCCSRHNPRDRGAFLVAVAEAFGDPLDDLLHSQLCLAFKKIVGEGAPKPARGSGGAVACSRSPSAPRGRM